jgi:hypothetical protein
LGICIDGNELNTRQPLGNHSVHGIAAASPDADHAYLSEILGLWHSTHCIPPWQHLDEFTIDS